MWTPDVANWHAAGAAPPGTKARDANAHNRNRRIAHEIHDALFPKD